MSNSTKIGWLIAVVLIAISIVLFFALNSNRASGTVDSEPRQMKPGARAKKPPLNSE